MDPIRQAAILVAALDMDSADALLEQMPDDFAAAVRNQVMELDQVDSAEEQSVIEKFLGREPDVEVRDSLELSDNTSAEPVPLTLEEYLTDVANESSEPGPVAHDVAESLERKPFEFLDHAEKEALLSVLRQEHAQTIALVLSHVASDLAAEVLSELPSDAQVDVARRMVELDQVDAHTLSEIEHGLHSRYRSQTGGDAEHTGRSAMRKIVASIDESSSDLLKNLQQADAKLAAQLTTVKLAATHEQRRPRERSPANGHAAMLIDMQFQDLSELNDADLGKVLQQADGRTLLLALAGASPALMDKVYSQLPRDDARTLRRQIEQQGTIRLRDVEEAQKRIGQVAASLAVEGEIDVPPGRRWAMAA